MSDYGMNCSFVKTRSRKPGLGGRAIPLVYSEKRGTFLL
jgi:predicted acetyltransferase